MMTTIDLPEEIRTILLPGEKIEISVESSNDSSPQTYYATDRRLLTFARSTVRSSFLFGGLFGLSLSRGKYVAAFDYTKITGITAIKYHPRGLVPLGVFILGVFSFIGILVVATTSPGGVTFIALGMLLGIPLLLRKITCFQFEITDIPENDKFRWRIHKPKFSKQNTGKFYDILKLISDKASIQSPI
jgi:hypothetical protein